MNSSWRHIILEFYYQCIRNKKRYKNRNSAIEPVVHSGDFHHLFANDVLIVFIDHEMC